MKCSRLVWFLRVFTVGSWLWLLFNTHEHAGFSLCIFKNLSGYPCPACGTTRSVLLILDGHFWQASLLNPLGWLALFGLILTSILLLFDFIRSTSYTEKLFFTLEKSLKVKPSIQVFILTLIILNWIWNIQKQL